MAITLHDFKSFLLGVWEWVQMWEDWRYSSQTPELQFVCTDVIRVNTIKKNSQVWSTISTVQTEQSVQIIALRCFYFLSHCTCITKVVFKKWKLPCWGRNFTALQMSFKIFFLSNNLLILSLLKTVFFGGSNKIVWNTINFKLLSSEITYWADIVIYQEPAFT